MCGQIMDIVSAVVALAQNRSLFAHTNGYNNKKNHQKRLVAMPCSGPQSKYLYAEIFVEHPNVDSKQLALGRFRIQGKVAG